jgi:hypothetical protein
VTAAHGLAAVIAAFVAILAGILAVALRERRLTTRLDAGDTTAASASDARVLIAIFVAIPGGMLLTVLSAWLVFL